MGREGTRVPTKLTRAAELVEEGEVGFGELVLHDFVEGDPAEVGDFEFLRLAGEDAGVEEDEPDVAVGIGVDDAMDFRADLRLDAQLLHKFPLQRRLQVFARIDFAARKFPVTAERVVRHPLRNEQPPIVATNNPGNHVNRRMSHDAITRVYEITRGLKNLAP